MDAVAMLMEQVEKLATDEEYRKAAFVGKPDGNPIALGPRVKSVTDWVEDMVDGAKARSSRWLKNSLSPKKNPKTAALAAAGKYEDKMRAALDGKHFDKGVEAYDEGAREEVIKAVGASGFSQGVERHKAKAIAKITKLQPLVTAVALANDKAPVDTDSDREAKMINNKRMMQQVGKIMKGVATGSPTTV